MVDTEWVVSKVVPPNTDHPTPPIEDKSPKDSGSVITTTDIKPPLSEYSRMNNHPYTMDYFKMHNFQGLGSFYDIHYKPKVDAIENFISGEIEHNGLLPTTDSYDQVMDKVFTFLNISKNDMPDKALEKILIYGRIVKEQRDYESRIKGALDDIKKRVRIDYE